MMDAVSGDTADPEIRKNYEIVISRYSSHAIKVGGIERSEFYERTSRAYIVIMTGDANKYGNILLKKGVTPYKIIEGVK